MMTDDTKLNASDKAMLDAFFADAADQRPDPSPDLMARILADAEAVQTAALAPPAAPPGAQEPGFFATLWAGLGGGAGLTGLITATLAGLWIGLSPPQVVDSVTASVLGTSDLLDGDGLPTLSFEGGLFDLAEAEEG